MTLELGFQLGDWHILPRRGTLHRGDEVRHLEPKVMAVLLCLAKNGDEVVRREDILDDVWADVVVGDEVLSRSISLLRTQLEDNPKQPTFIQTVPKIGYRLIATIDHVSADEPVSSPSKFRERNWLWILAAAVIVVSVSLLIATQPEKSTPNTVETTVPVSPGACEQTIKMASAKLQQRGEDALRRSIVLYQSALAECPELADAALGLATAYVLLPTYTGEQEDTSFINALAELKLVEDLAGASGRIYAVKAFIAMQQMKWTEANALFKQAIEQSSTTAYAHQWYSQFLARVGYLDQSLEQAQRAVSVSGGSPEDIHRLAIAYLWNNENELAAQHFKLAMEAGKGPYVNQEASLVLLFRQGKYREAGLQINGFLQSRNLPADWVEVYVKAMRSRVDEDIETAIAALEQAYPDNVPTSIYWGGMMLLQSEKTLAITNQLLTRLNLDYVELFFASEGATLRANPAFSVFVRESGLDTYWDKHGWPPACNRENDLIVCR